MSGQDAASVSTRGGEASDSSKTPVAGAPLAPPRRRLRTDKQTTAEAVAPSPAAEAGPIQLVATPTSLHDAEAAGGSAAVATATVSSPASPAASSDEPVVAVRRKRHRAKTDESISDTAAVTTAKGERIPTASTVAVAAAEALEPLPASGARTAIASEAMAAPAPSESRAAGRSPAAGLANEPSLGSATGRRRKRRSRSSDAPSEPVADAHVGPEAQQQPREKAQQPLDGAAAARERSASRRVPDESASTKAARSSSRRRRRLAQSDDDGSRSDYATLVHSGSAAGGGQSDYERLDASALSGAGVGGALASGTETSSDNLRQSADSDSKRRRRRSRSHSPQQAADDETARRASATLSGPGSTTVDSTPHAVARNVDAQDKTTAVPTSGEARDAAAQPSSPGAHARSHRRRRSRSSDKVEATDRSQPTAPGAAETDRPALSSSADPPASAHKADPAPLLGGAHETANPGDRSVALPGSAPVVDDTAAAVASQTTAAAGPLTAEDGQSDFVSRSSNQSPRRARERSRRRRPRLNDGADSEDRRQTITTATASSSDASDLSADQPASVGEESTPPRQQSDSSGQQQTIQRVDATESKVVTSSASATAPPRRAADDASQEINLAGAATSIDGRGLEVLDERSLSRAPHGRSRRRRSRSSESSETDEKSGPAAAKRPDACGSAGAERAAPPPPGVTTLDARGSAPPPPLTHSAAEQASSALNGESSSAAADRAPSTATSSRVVMSPASPTVNGERDTDASSSAEQSHGRERARSRRRRRSQSNDATKTGGESLLTTTSTSLARDLGKGRPPATAGAEQPQAAPKDDAKSLQQLLTADDAAGGVPTSSAVIPEVVTTVASSGASAAGSKCDENSTSQSLSVSSFSSTERRASRGRQSRSREAGNLSSDVGRSQATTISAAADAHRDAGECGGPVAGNTELPANATRERNPSQQQLGANQTNHGVSVMIMGIDYSARDQANSAASVLADSSAPTAEDNSDEATSSLSQSPSLNEPLSSSIAPKQTSRRSRSPRRAAADAGGRSAVVAGSSETPGRDAVKSQDVLAGASALPKERHQRQIVSRANKDDKCGSSNIAATQPASVGSSAPPAPTPFVPSQPLRALFSASVEDGAESQDNDYAVLDGNVGKTGDAREYEALVAASTQRADRPPAETRPELVDPVLCGATSGAIERPAVAVAASASAVRTPSRAMSSGTDRGGSKPAEPLAPAGSAGETDAGGAKPPAAVIAQNEINDKQKTIAKDDWCEREAAGHSGPRSSQEADNAGPAAETAREEVMDERGPLTARDWQQRIESIKQQSADRERSADSTAADGTLASGRMTEQPLSGKAATEATAASSPRPELPLQPPASGASVAEPAAGRLPAHANRALAGGDDPQRKVRSAPVADISSAPSTDPRPSPVTPPATDRPSRGEAGQSSAALAVQPAVSDPSRQSGTSLAAELDQRSPRPPSERPEDVVSVRSSVVVPASRSDARLQGAAAKSESSAPAFAPAAAATADAKTANELSRSSWSSSERAAGATRSDFGESLRSAASDAARRGTGVPPRPSPVIYADELQAVMCSARAGDRFSPSGTPVQTPPPPPPPPPPPLRTMTAHQYEVAESTKVSRSLALDDEKAVSTATSLSSSSRGAEEHDSSIELGRATLATAQSLASARCGLRQTQQISYRTLEAARDLRPRGATALPAPNRYIAAVAGGVQQPMSRDVVSSRVTAAGREQDDRWAGVTSSGGVCARDGQRLAWPHPRPPAVSARSDGGRDIMAGPRRPLDSVLDDGAHTGADDLPSANHGERLPAARGIRNYNDDGSEAGRGSNANAPNVHSIAVGASGHVDGSATESMPLAQVNAVAIKRQAFRVERADIGEIRQSDATVVTAAASRESGAAVPLHDFDLARQRAAISRQLLDRQQAVVEAAVPPSHPAAASVVAADLVVGGCGSNQNAAAAEEPGAVAATSLASAHRGQAFLAAAAAAAGRSMHFGPDLRSRQGPSSAGYGSPPAGAPLDPAKRRPVARDGFLAGSLHRTAALLDRESLAASEAAAGSEAQGLTAACHVSARYGQENLASQSVVHRAPPPHLTDARRRDASATSTQENQPLAPAASQNALQRMPTHRNGSHVLDGEWPLHDDANGLVTGRSVALETWTAANIRSQSTAASASRDQRRQQSVSAALASAGFPLGRDASAPNSNVNVDGQAKCGTASHSRADGSSTAPQSDGVRASTAGFNWTPRRCENSCVVAAGAKRVSRAWTAVERAPEQEAASGAAPSGGERKAGATAQREDSEATAERQGDATRRDQPPPERKDSLVAQIRMKYEGARAADGDQRATALYKSGSTGSGASSRSTAAARAMTNAESRASGAASTPAKKATAPTASVDPVAAAAAVIPPGAAAAVAMAAKSAPPPIPASSPRTPDKAPSPWRPELTLSAMPIMAGLSTNVNQSANSRSGTARQKDGDDDYEPELMFSTTNPSFYFVLLVLSELNNHARLLTTSVQRATIRDIEGNADGGPSARCDFGSSAKTAVYAFAKTAASVLRMVMLRACNVPQKNWPSASSVQSSRNKAKMTYEQLAGEPFALCSDILVARKYWSEFDRLYPHFFIEKTLMEAEQRGQDAAALNSVMIIFRRDFREVIEITMTCDVSNTKEMTFRSFASATCVRREIAPGEPKFWTESLLDLVAKGSRALAEHFGSVRGLSTRHSPRSPSRYGANLEADVSRLFTSLPGPKKPAADQSRELSASFRKIQ